MKVLFIKKKEITKSIVFSMFLLMSMTIHAQNPSPDTTAVSDSKKFKQAINFCPLALAFGIYSINYERLLNKHHGVLIRGDYESIPKNYSEANIDVSGKAVILNYRYHVKGGLNSFFVGIFSRYRTYSGSGNLNESSFDFDISEFTVGANFGKRWILKNGLNLNLVWGYGFFMDNLNSKESQTDIINSIHTFQNQYDLYNGMYGEFSIGYAF